VPKAVVAGLAEGDVVGGKQETGLRMSVDDSLAHTFGQILKP
jgi:hypothetical protein